MKNFNYASWVEAAFYYARKNKGEYADCQNWVLANYLFGHIGRTQATQFCEQLGIDPDSHSLEKIK